MIFSYDLPLIFSVSNCRHTNNNKWLLVAVLRADGEKFVWVIRAGEVDKMQHAGFYVFDEIFDCNVSAAGTLCDDIWVIEKAGGRGLSFSSCTGHLDDVFS